MAHIKKTMKKTSTARKQALPAPEEKAIEKYEPTDHEREAARIMRERTTARPPAPGIKMTRGKDGRMSWEMDHQNITACRVLMDSAFAAAVPIRFTYGILKQIVHTVSGPNYDDEQAVNFALAVIDGVEPRDQLETMLAAQMAVVHIATMKMARRLGNAETIQQKDSAERALNKLALTFTSQMEALKRYRTGGEQKVTVHHVTVNEGGQAIVGHVEQSKTGGEGEHGKE